MKLRTPCGVVPALDTDTVDELRRVVERTCDVAGIVGYKLGLSGTLRLGLAGCVRAIRELTDLPILYDHQKAGADIPDMAAKFAATCAEAGVDALILFPLSGPHGVRGFVGEALRHGLEPIVGGDLPHPQYRAGDGGYVADDAPDRIVALAAEIGATHFVVPANDRARIERRVGDLRARVDRPVLFLPGIGPLGGSVADAFSATGGCPSYAIAGRAIYASPDPREAARRLAAEALQFV